MAQASTRKEYTKWDQREQNAVHAEYLRLLGENPSYKTRALATQNCQAVLPVNRRKSYSSISVFRDWMEKNPVEVVTISSTVVPLAKTPISLSPVIEEAAQASAKVEVEKVAALTTKDMARISDERASLAGKMPSLEEFLASYIKTEIENILAPVRKASEVLESELGARVVNPQTQPRKINFFPKSAEQYHQDQAGSELPNGPGKATSQVTAHPLVHTVGIIGLLDREASSVKQSLSPKLYVRFVKNENIKRAMNSVQNLQHILVWQKHCSHSLTKALENRGLKEKVILVNSITDIRNNLTRIAQLPQA